jgi:hypothetical protein
MIVSMAGFCTTGVEPSGSRAAVLEPCHLEDNDYNRNFHFYLHLSQNFSQHNQRDPNRLVG